MNGREKCKAALTRRLQQERQSQLQLNRNRKNGRISNYELDNINRDNKSIKSEILSLESALAKVDRGIALAPDQKALLEEHMLAQADKFIQGRFLGAKERARLTAMKELEDKKAQADRLGALNSSDPMLQQQLSQLLGGASNCDYVLQKLNDGIPLSEEEMVVLVQANHNHLMMSSQLAVEATRQVEALSAKVAAQAKRRKEMSKEKRDRQVQGVEKQMERLRDADRHLDEQRKLDEEAAQLHASMKEVRLLSNFLFLAELVLHCCSCCWVLIASSPSPPKRRRSARVSRWSRHASRSRKSRRRLPWSR